MTGRNQGEPSDPGKIGRPRSERLVFRIPETELVAVSGVYRETARQCAVDYQIPRVHNDHRFILHAFSINVARVRACTDTQAYTSRKANGFLPPLCCREREKISPALATQVAVFWN